MNTYTCHTCRASGPLTSLRYHPERGYTCPNGHPTITIIPGARRKKNRIPAPEKHNHV